MRKRDLDRFRNLLETRLVELYRAAHRTARWGMERHSMDQDTPRDEGDEAQRVQARDLQMGLAENEARLAQQMEEALKRITRGVYGQCVDCGGPIEISRLRAVPWALRCAEDQEALEYEARDRSPSL
ncbi:MAG: TraR/DksA family transcriptional regulator [Deltaproteobacteria bacterium]|nr:TraR/DksA family transcriptional regulator [Deltaproteobacteria bacterium]